MARWRRQGVGPRFVKIGRKVGYTYEALETYIEQNTRLYGGCLIRTCERAQRGHP